MNEQKVREIAQKVFWEQMIQNQYSVSSIPFHIHNNTDSPNIPPTSVQNFVTLPANNSKSGTNDGVLSTNKIGVSTPPYPIIYPTPVIRGEGVGVFNQFNGGGAPFGSLIVFMANDPSVVPNSMNIMLENALGVPTWYGIDLGTGLAGVKYYYVSDTSGGAVTRKLTFTNGILTAET